MSTPSATTPALTLDQIEAAAAKLSVEERDELVRFLVDFDSEADPGAEAAWDAEISRRLDEVRSGKVKCIPFKEVMADVKARFCK